jgi:hypothetical protein
VIYKYNTKGLPEFRNIFDKDLQPFYCLELLNSKKELKSPSLIFGIHKAKTSYKMDMEYEKINGAQ